MKRADIPGGIGDKTKPEDVDPKQLEMGIKVEMEHTSDLAIAEEIALDHLTENPEYYTALKTIEPEHFARQADVNLWKIWDKIQSNLDSIDVMVHNIGSKEKAQELAKVLKPISDSLNTVLKQEGAPVFGKMTENVVARYQKTTIDNMKGKK